MERSILAIALLTGSLAANSPALAQTIPCPSPSDIKAKQFDAEGCMSGSEWCAFNTLNEFPAKPEKIKKFVEEVDRFWLTEWSQYYTPHAQCHYYPISEVMLARNTSGTAGDHWQKKTNLEKCEAKRTDCLFSLTQK